MNYRRQLAQQKREQAALLASQRPHQRHISNGAEYKFRHSENTAATHGLSSSLPLPPSYLLNFTKGLDHNKSTGLVRVPDDYELFVKAIDNGDARDFKDIPIGNVGKDKWRAWESQGAGLAFDLEGPDAQAVIMPPAPTLGSEELVAEMGEVYVQALLRDVPFSNYTPLAGTVQPNAAYGIEQNHLTAIENQVTALNKLPWFNGAELKSLSPAETIRRRGKLQRHTAFRGITIGDNVGPYLSQFLLVGNKGVNGKDSNANNVADGQISFGSIRISQHVRVAEAGKDYLMDWEKWLKVQNGLDLRGMETYDPKNKYRFIYTPRDLSTYVHYDALYEAYLNACLILFGMGAPFDPGLPFLDNDAIDHQQGFAHFGGPHILSLVTEVATRALKAVRFQKFNVHRRCRPEVLAARLEKVDILEDMAPELRKMYNELKGSGILTSINKHNKLQGSNTVLLPMAFAEGSPMHPAYGAGHATVAGACVTILKAFFDAGYVLDFGKPASGKGGKTAGAETASSYAYVSVDQGQKLALVPVYDENGNPAKLTVEGELNKLASNIAIGRDWAGVHYFTDYYESLLLGEQIAIGILEEQKLTYGENFSMTVPLFGGGAYRI